MTDTTKKKPAAKKAAAKKPIAKKPELNHKFSPMKLFLQRTTILRDANPACGEIPMYDSRMDLIREIEGLMIESISAEFEANPQFGPADREEALNDVRAAVQAMKADKPPAVQLQALIETLKQHKGSFLQGVVDDSAFATTGASGLRAPVI